MRRRALLLTALSLGLPGRALGLGRTPRGGTLSFRVPWALGTLDPHDWANPVAGLCAPAVFDTLYTPVAKTPMLAEELPRKEGARVVVPLRTGLRTARGKAVGPAEVVASLKRASAMGARFLLDPLGPFEVGPGHSIAFSKATAAALVETLSLPIFAIVPSSFSPVEPDGTGAFLAQPSANRLTLTRNPSSAMGPAFLDSLKLESAADLRESLREFEVGRDDLGWLGAGLATPRPSAQRFDFSSVGSFVLTANGDTPLAKPGALQKLVDRIPKAALSHLALGPLPDAGVEAENPGGPITLFVDHGAHLAEVAEAIAGAISQPDHEVTVRQTSRADIAARRRRNETMLALFTMRTITHAADSLALAADPDLRGKRATSSNVRDAASLAAAAFVGDVRVHGARMPRLELRPGHGGRGFDLANSFMRPPS